VFDQELGQEFADYTSSFCIDTKLNAFLNLKKTMQILRVKQKISVCRTAPISIRWHWHQNTYELPLVMHWCQYCYQYQPFLVILYLLLIKWPMPQQILYMMSINCFQDGNMCSDFLQKNLSPWMKPVIVQLNGWEPSLKPYVMIVTVHCSDSVHKGSQN